MIERIEVTAGSGTVIRYGGIVAWVDPAASAALISFLAQSARNLSPSPRGGRQIVDHIATVLATRDPEPHVGFAVIGPSDHMWAALLHGPVQAWDGIRWLAPTPSPGWLQASITPRPAITVGGAGTSVPAIQPDDMWDLEAGVVPGSGFVLVPAGSLERSTLTGVYDDQVEPDLEPDVEPDLEPDVEPDVEPELALEAQVRADPRFSAVSEEPPEEVTAVLAISPPTIVLPTVVADLASGPEPSAEPGLAAATVSAPAMEPNLGPEPAAAAEPPPDPEPADAQLFDPEPADALPADPEPADALPADPEPADALLFEQEPAEAMLFEQEPADALPAAPEPAHAVLPEAEPADAVLPEAEPEPALLAGPEPESPPPPESSPPPEPVPRPRRPIVPGPAGSLDLRYVVVPANPPLPRGTRPDQRVPGAPVVAGILCTYGHLNRPGLTTCVRCRTVIPAGTRDPISGTRPSLGVLIADDGIIYRLDHGYLVGSQPDRDPTVGGGLARPLTLTGRDVSGSHAEVRLTDWDVSILDRASPAGTCLFEPGATEWTRLKPYEPRVIAPGTHVSFGQRLITFISPWVVPG